ncbi:MAG: STAS domain-containing protein [Gammaproteobacteria bacterium]|nr:STAS domain-containing protein [Gammaproteobacteria bacterium]MCY4275972.1 STAS domain-containing protein [Gammaproteobacteria bacterium]
MINIEINNGRLVLEGELNIQTVPNLFKRYPHFAEPVHTIDLSKIEKVDSSGLALLIYWHAKLNETSEFSGFNNCPKHTLAIAKLVGLEAIFDV